MRVATTQLRDQLAGHVVDRDAGDAADALVLGKVSAAIGYNDLIAIGALQRLRATGVRVPDDLSLIGFDDHALAEQMGLSTVAQPVEALGTQAATMALALAAGDTLPREVVLVPTRLVLRRTTSRRTG